MTVVTLTFPNLKLDQKGKEELETLIDTMFNQDLLFDDGNGNEHNACCPTVEVRDVA